MTSTVGGLVDQRPVRPARNQPVDDTSSSPSSAIPSLADDIELIGEYEGSGYKKPPSLVRRGDGQVIQLTPLLYSVAEKADGARDYEGIASALSDEIGRSVSSDNVRFLVEQKLQPLGILAGPDGTAPDAGKLDPLLALKFRAAVIPEWLSHVLASVFRPLFFGPVVLAALGGLVVTDLWLFGHHGVAQGIREAMYRPETFLLMFALIAGSAAFHEIGHAAACR